MNNLTIEIYSGGTTRILDPRNDQIKAQNLRFATGYPGGLYLDGSFYIPRDVLDFLPIKGNYRVVFRNGQNIVYEGWVDELVSQLNETDQGIEIPLVGAWGRFLMRNLVRKNWADNRVSEDVWVYNPTPEGEAFCDVSRLTDAGPAILFNPNNVAWGSATYAQCTYTMPYGQTVKRVTCDYELVTEGSAPNWGLYLVNGASGVNIGTLAARTSAGTTTGGSATAFDGTLATPIQSIGLRLYSGTSQTPTGDGSTYAEISDLVVYSETGNINLTEIAKDIIALSSGLNSDTTHIDTITDTGGIIPFIADRWESHADVLTRAAAFGDDDFDKWAVGVYHSEIAATPNGYGVLFAEQQPALTNYDYVISIDEENLVAPFGLTRDFSNIWNWIAVEYYDENGNYQTIRYIVGTYDGLYDADSVTAYGTRQYVLNVGNSTAAAAYDSGRRFLAAYKDPQYVLTSPITVMDYIRKKDGSRLPVSEIVAGKRVKIENYLEDLSGTGLTFLISHTDYDDDNETCSIQAGLPRDLIFPTFVFDPVGMAPGPSGDAVASTAAGGGGGADRLNWKRQYGLTPGTPEWAEAERLGRRAWEQKYPNKKRKRRR